MEELYSTKLKEDYIKLNEYYIKLKQLNEKCVETNLEFEDLNQEDYDEFYSVVAGAIGMNFVPYLTRETSRLGAIEKEYICVGTVQPYDCPNGIYIVKAKKVVIPEMEYRLKNITKAISTEPYIEVFQISAYDKEVFYQQYEPKLGITLTPICSLIHEGKRQFLVQERILCLPFQIHYLCLGYREG